MDRDGEDFEVRIVGRKSRRVERREFDVMVDEGDKAAAQTPTPTRSRRRRAKLEKQGSADEERSLDSWMQAMRTLLLSRKTSSSFLEVLMPLVLNCRRVGIGRGGVGRATRVGPGLTWTLPEMRRSSRRRRREKAREK